MKCWQCGSKASDIYTFGDVAWCLDCGRNEPRISVAPYVWTLVLVTAVLASLLYVGMVWNEKERAEHGGPKTEVIRGR